MSHFKLSPVWYQPSEISTSFLIHASIAQHVRVVIRFRNPQISSRMALAYPIWIANELAINIIPPRWLIKWIWFAWSIWALRVREISSVCTSAYGMNVWRFRVEIEMDDNWGMLRWISYEWLVFLSFGLWWNPTKLQTGISLGWAMFLSFYLCSNWPKCFFELL